jgi:hypothetical protein
MTQPYSIADLRAAIDAIRDLKQVQAAQDEVLMSLISRVVNIEALADDIAARLDAIASAAQAKPTRASRRGG